MAKKLNAPAKSPKGGTGGMRVDMNDQDADDLYGPSIKQAPGPATLASSETYGENGESHNGSESDSGLMDRGRKSRNHEGRGFGSSMMKK